MKTGTMPAKAAKQAARVGPGGDERARLPQPGAEEQEAEDRADDAQRTGIGNGREAGYRQISSPIISKAKSPPKPTRR